VAFPILSCEPQSPLIAERITTLLLPYIDQNNNSATQMMQIFHSCGKMGKKFAQLLELLSKTALQA